MSTAQGQAGADGSEPGTPSQKHTAGAYDVRTVIAGLIGLYGVVLTIMGLVDPDQSSDKTGGVNANLWAGLGMLAVALGFALWVKLRPIVLEDGHLTSGA